MKFIKSDFDKKMEIDCIKVKKVFEECSDNFIAKVKIPISPPHMGHHVKCGDVHIKPNHLECEVDEECSSVKIFDEMVKIDIQLNLIHEGHMHPVEASGTLIIPDDKKEFILDRAGEPGLDCEVEIFAECLDCRIICKSHEGMVSEISCCIGILIIAKLVAEVQLQVPTFGYCQVPKKCKGKRPCPTKYEPEEIPFPKQTKEKHKEEHDCDKDDIKKDCKKTDKFEPCSCESFMDPIF